MEKETRLKRLYFRSAHRGSKENDLILEPYAQEQLPLMDDAMLDIYEAFLEEGDNDIWDWVCGKSEPQDDKYRMLIRQLRKRYELK